MNGKSPTKSQSSTRQDKSFEMSPSQKNHSPQKSQNNLEKSPKLMHDSPHKSRILQRQGTLQRQETMSKKTGHMHRSATIDTRVLSGSRDQSFNEDQENDELNVQAQKRLEIADKFVPQFEVFINKSDKIDKLVQEKLSKIELENAQKDMAAEIQIARQQTHKHPRQKKLVTNLANPSIIRTGTSVPRQFGKKETKANLLGDSGIIEEEQEQSSEEIKSKGSTESPLTFSSSCGSLKESPQTKNSQERLNKASSQKFSYTESKQEDQSPSSSPGLPKKKLQSSQSFKIKAPPKDTKRGVITSVSEESSNQSSSSFKTDEESQESPAQQTNKIEKQQTLKSNKETKSYVTTSPIKRNLVSQSSLRFSSLRQLTQKKLDPQQKDWAGKQAGNTLNLMRTQSRFGSKLMTANFSRLSGGRQDVLSAASSYMDIENMSSLGSAMRGLSRLLNSQSDLESSNQEAIQAFFEKKLKQQAKKMQKIHHIELKNVRKVMIEVAVDWLKEKCKSLEVMFTKNHRNLHQQFLDFKARTKQNIDKLETYQSKQKVAEISNSQRFFIDEAEYQINHRQCLQLYDPLVSQIKEHVKIRKMSTAAQMVYSRQKQQNREEAEASEIDHLKNLNALLEERVRHHENELSLIQWYITVLEDGQDTKGLLEDYVKMKQKLKSVNKELSKQQQKSKDEIDKLKHKLRQMQEQLKKQHYEVTVPLMEEAKRQQTEIAELNEKIQYQLNQISILVSTLRLPRMSDQFRRAIKRHSKPDTFLKHEQEAITTLSRHIDESNEEEFFEDLLQKVIKGDPKQQSPRILTRGKNETQNRTIIVKIDGDSPSSEAKIRLSGMAYSPTEQDKINLLEMQASQLENRRSIHRNRRTKQWQIQSNQMSDQTIREVFQRTYDQKQSTVISSGELTPSKGFKMSEQALATLSVSAEKPNRKQQPQTKQSTLSYGASLEIQKILTKDTPSQIKKKESVSQKNSPSKINSAKYFFNNKTIRVLSQSREYDKSASKTSNTVSPRSPQRSISTVDAGADGLQQIHSIIMQQQQKITTNQKVSNQNNKELRMAKWRSLRVPKTTAHTSTHSRERV